MSIKNFILQDVSWKKNKTWFSYFAQRHQIAQRANAFSEKHFIALRIFLTLCFVFIVFWESWTSDDAYHSYIMARHLAEGKGLVYNVGYRVSASTCPLMTLIEAFLYKLFHNMEATGIVLGVTTSGSAAAVLFFKFCKK